MRIPTTALSCAVAAAIGLAATATLGQVASRTATPAEQTLEQAATGGQFVFVVFYKADDNPSRAMRDAVEKALAARSGDAVLAQVQITSAAEKKLVDKFAVSRAPMPLVLAVAPNGAVTGVFRAPPTAENVTAAIVTPTMTHCMKAMQDGKLVAVCVHGAKRVPTPAAVIELQTLPQFKDRVATVALNLLDPAETDFLTQLKIDASNPDGIATVILAPPGVLVGRYTSAATADEMAAALHEAGKCCDDENCKHHKPAAGAAKHSSTQKPVPTKKK